MGAKGARPALGCRAKGGPARCSGSKPALLENRDHGKRSSAPRLRDRHDPTRVPPPKEARAKLEPTVIVIDLNRVVQGLRTGDHAYMVGNFHKISILKQSVKQPRGEGKAGRGTPTVGG